MKVLLESENGRSQICVTVSKVEEDSFGLQGVQEFITTPQGVVPSIKETMKAECDCRIITYSWTGGLNQVSIEVPLNCS